MSEKAKKIGNNLDFYIENQAELVKKYEGRYIVIHAQKVYGAYSDLRKAVLEARKEFAPGTYQVQLVEPGEGSYQKIISRTRLYA